ncbi:MULTISPECIES: M16 family metallopeptidase [Brucella]|jgi:predicted Zn-dependent peptidase|uniref:Peptidase M16 n=2 Tax=Brucella TaxID=234 RepID=A0A656Z5Y1_BRUAN|nr:MULTISPECIES: pitrilysin family protein [Brucella]EMG55151.1 processing peptidase [Ochrobactrum sp. CDB2]KYB44905.1 peptidase M16 [Brucella anthropi]MBK0020484.1 insulinase family protein [Ochrobactrum sp. S45]MBK0042776.1 insulinase family protein [Ochrobactrum sp. S46]MBO1024360.1 insulinase family protein [Ochrobactrum sp. SD129]MQP41793.1 insulinase family protein [Ochrobactrum sp. MYb237]QWK78138.1 insulinase family protein [Ochrobactrum sp. BTU1]
MGVEVTRLSNGLTIATDNMPHVESVALGIWVKAGARNEAPDRHGIAHLLEHMAFKGTEKRTAWQIASDIENVGGEINAATSVETTSYYARVLRNDVPLAIDILADILTASKFDEAELEREKQVIMQEIGAAHDTPDDIVFDRFTETAYRHQPIGRAILGEPDTVMSFTSADLRQYMDEQYSADRMVVTAAGGIDHDQFVKEVEQRLGGFRAHNTAPTLDLATYVGGDFREDRDLMDAQVLIGFEGRAYHVRDFYASQLLSMILGGGMSSRLFQEVREKRGLCYSVYAFHWGFSDTGLFGIHAATGRDELVELLPVIIDELHKAADSIQLEEVNRARAQYSASLLMSQESAASRAGQLARQFLLYGRPVANSELMDRLSQITPERLSDLAGRLFLDTKPTIAGVGPVGRLMSFDRLTDALSTSAHTRKIAV